MDRTFHGFIAFSALSLLSAEIFVLAIPLTVLALGYSSIEVGWCTFAYFLPVVGGKLLAGPLIETVPKKPVLMSSEIGKTLLFVAALAAMASSLPYIGYMPVVCFLAGVLTVVTDVAEPPALKALLAKDRMSSALATYEIRTRGVQLVGPALCGLLIGYGHGWPLGVALGLSAVAALALYLTALPEADRPERMGMISDLRSALSWTLTQPGLVVLVLLSALNNFIHPVLYLAAIYTLATGGYGGDTIGLMLSGLGVGGLIGSFGSAFLLRRFEIGRIFLGVNVGRVLVFLGFVFARSPEAMFALFVAKAILGGTWNVCYNVFTLELMPATLVARVSALSGLVIKGATALGGLIGGYMIAFAGVGTTLEVLFAIAVAMLLLSVIKPLAVASRAD